MFYLLGSPIKKYIECEVDGVLAKGAINVGKLVGCSGATIRTLLKKEKEFVYNGKNVKFIRWVKPEKRRKHGA